MNQVLKENQKIASGKTPATLGTKEEDSSSPLGIGFWRKLFFIEYKDLKQRIIGSFLPNKAKEISKTVEEKPDLYGPIWITAFIIFLTIISISLVPILKKVFTQGSNQVASYKISTIGYLFGFMYSILIIYPSIYTIILKLCAKKDGKTASNIHSICIHGYGSVPFVISSLLCLYPNRLWRFIILLLAAIYSGLIMIIKYDQLPNPHKILLPITSRCLTFIVLFFAY